MTLTPDIRRQLIEAGSRSDEDINLTETALLLGSIFRPNVRLDAYRRHLVKLTSDVKQYLHGLSRDPDLEQRAEALRQVLHCRYGYTGTEESFHDPDGANLTYVIDRRSGLPVTLGILYLIVARAQGWAAEGIDFPGRFLVRLEDLGERLLIDPFGGGRILSILDLREMLKGFSGNHAELKPRHYRQIETRAVLLRLEGNIKGRLLREDKTQDALRVIETMLLFAPEEADIWHECGLLHARLGNLPEAISALEEYLRLSPDMNIRYDASLLLQELRQRLI